MENPRLTSLACGEKTSSNNRLAAKDVAAAWVSKAAQRDARIEAAAA